MKGSQIKDWLLVASSLLQGLSILGIAVSLIIYRQQRRSSLESEKQANRSRVVEAYMRWHAEILRSDKSLELASKLFRWSYPIIGSDLGKVYDEQTRQIHFIYMFLNALCLEWKYLHAYNVPMKEFDEFYKTVDTVLFGLATSTDPEYQRLADHFTEIFPDFPDDFMTAVSARIQMLKEVNAARGVFIRPAATKLNGSMAKHV